MFKHYLAVFGGGYGLGFRPSDELVSYIKVEQFSVIFNVVRMENLLELIYLYHTSSRVAS